MVAVSLAVIFPETEPTVTLPSTRNELSPDTTKELTLLPSANCNVGTFSATSTTSTFSPVTSPSKGILFSVPAS